MIKISKYAVLLTLIVCLAAGSGCADAPQGAVGGSLIGAGIGALIGAAAGDPGLGAVIGGAVGGLAGAAAGAENQRRRTVALLAQLPPLPDGWNQPGGTIISPDKRGLTCYWLNGDHLVLDPSTRSWCTED